MTATLQSEGEMSGRNTVFEKLAEMIRRDKAESNRKKRKSSEECTAEAIELAQKHLIDMKDATSALYNAASFLADRSLLVCCDREVIRIAKLYLTYLEDRHTIRTKTAADYWERIAEQYRTSLRAMLAMHLTPLIEPDVAIPSDGYSYGYSINTHGEKVKVLKAASSSYSHWSTWDLKAEYPKPGLSKSRESWSQNAMRLYSTIELAMKAGRAELAWRFANVLAGIDKQIEESAQKWKQADSATLQTVESNDDAS